MWLQWLVYILFILKRALYRGQNTWLGSSETEPTFTILCLNTRSIFNKVLDLEHLLLSMDPDVVTIAETWLCANIGDHEIVPPNYIIIKKDRLSRAGGVVIALRQNLSYGRSSGR